MPITSSIKISHISTDSDILEFRGLVFLKNYQFTGSTFSVVKAPDTLEGLTTNFFITDQSVLTNIESIPLIKYNVKENKEFIFNFDNPVDFDLIDCLCGNYYYNHFNYLRIEYKDNDNNWIPFNINESPIFNKNNRSSKIDIQLFNKEVFNIIKDTESYIRFGRYQYYIADVVNDSDNPNFPIYQLTFVSATGNGTRNETIHTFNNNNKVYLEFNVKTNKEFNHYRDRSDAYLSLKSNPSRYLTLMFGNDTNSDNKKVSLDLLNFRIYTLTYGANSVNIIHTLALPEPETWVKVGLYIDPVARTIGYVVNGVEYLDIPLDTVTTNVNFDNNTTLKLNSCQYLDNLILQIPTLATDKKFSDYKTLNTYGNTLPSYVFKPIFHRSEEADTQMMDLSDQPAKDKNAVIKAINRRRGFIFIKDFTNYHGFGYIKANVYVEKPPKEPISKVVLLYSINDNKVLQETISDSLTGLFEFKHIKMGIPYLIVAHDPDSVYDSVSIGPIYPKLMPQYEGKV